MNIKFLLRSALPAATLFSTLCMATAVEAVTVIPLTPFNVFGPTDFEGDVEIEVAGGEAMFTFATTAGGPTTSIARIYFETDLGLILSGTADLDPSPFAGVIFSPDASPQNPPAGNTAPQVPWDGTFSSFGADPPPSMEGINVGESLGITYSYNGTEADLVAAIIDEFGNSRLAVHVLNCQGMDSCTGTAVPVPAAVWLFGSGLLGLVGVARRKRS